MSRFAIPRSRIVSTVLLIAAFALLIRIAVIPFVIADTVNPARDHWKFGWEEGRIARSIASGEGFSSPLFGKTGPTSWTMPIYPYLLAGVFRVFGVYSYRSAWVILILNGLFSALTCVPIYFVASRLFGPTAALWAAITWALYPYAIHFSTTYVWDYCLNTVMLAFLLWATLAMEDETRLWRWVAYGLLWGVTALTNAVALTMLPFLLGWLIWRHRRQGNPWRLHAIALVLTLCVTVSPWFVRNYLAFGRVIPFRGTFWMIFWESNTGDISDLYPDWTNPAHSEKEMEEYRRLGEMGYADEKRIASFAILAQQPHVFAWLFAKRVLFTWTGYWSTRPEYLAGEPMAYPNMGFTLTLTALLLIGIRRAWKGNHSGAVPLVLALLSYPVVYYVTHPGMEYRHPIDPICVIFVGWLASDLALWGRVKRLF
jgi:4-amino-4-deoxy-L-arabinose transferase-like glycosyltransferase